MISAKIGLIMIKNELKKQTKIDIKFFSVILNYNKETVKFQLNGKQIFEGTKEMFLGISEATKKFIKKNELIYHLDIIIIYYTKEKQHLEIYFKDEKDNKQFIEQIL